MTQGLASVLVVYLLLVAVLALLAVAGVRLASAVRTGVVVAEVMLVAEAVLAVARMLAGDRPADPLVHLGYVAVSVVLLPLLLRPPEGLEGRGETVADQRGHHAVVALACLVTAVVVVRQRATAWMLARRLLVVAYTVLAIASGARATVQISTRLAEAPLPYLLSGVSAVVYLVAAVALRRPGSVARRVAATALVLELVGVLVVGTLSVVDAGDFPDETVWSTYGVGYGFLPVVLPILGLVWLRRSQLEVARTVA